MDQLQLMRTNFGSHLDHLSDEMRQMNTKIGCIARRQSCISGFTSSPSSNPTEESSDGGDDKSHDASGSTHNDEVADS